MRRALLVIGVLCLGVPSALAKPSTTVFPLTAPNLPMKIASAPEQLSQALAEKLDGDVAKVPIDDAAGIEGCDPEATTCLETVAKKFKVKRIVFGSIAMLDETRLKVTLTRFELGPDRQQRSFTVEGSVEEMAEELVSLSCSLFESEGCEETESTEGPKKTPLETEDPIIVEPVAKGEIGATTYVFLVGGGAMTAAGVGFLVSAYGIGQDVASTKPRTDADFKKLVLLENKGAQRQTIGTVLTGVGVVAIGYGIIRAVQERSAGGSSESRSVSKRKVTPVPLEGGAALVFSMELP